MLQKKHIAQCTIHGSRPQVQGQHLFLPAPDSASSFALVVWFGHFVRLECVLLAISLISENKCLIVESRAVEESSVQRSLANAEFDDGASDDDAHLDSVSDSYLQLSQKKPKLRIANLAIPERLATLGPSNAVELVKSRNKKVEDRSKNSLQVKIDLCWNSGLVLLFYWNFPPACIVAGNSCFCSPGAWNHASWRCAI
ncbi:hypothetical protein PTKIN_Ptkin09bG0271700 [Pterospermum kingtungense]